MEENLIIYKNKGQVFNCHLEVDGVANKEVQLRLCLELKDNKNMFFLGKINEDGDCSFNIPKLKDIDGEAAKMTIEAIADSTYFKLYETEVELKNSVEINFSKKNETIEPVGPSIKMSKGFDVKEKPVVTEAKKEPEKKKEPDLNSGWRDFKDYQKQRKNK